MTLKREVGLLLGLCCDFNISRLKNRCFWPLSWTMYQEIIVLDHLRDVLFWGKIYKKKKKSPKTTNYLQYSSSMFKRY